MEELSTDSGKALEELARQNLTDAEVREVLERLGAEQFGDGQGSTIRDVCEATGASETVIGRILGEIRTRDLNERFGSKIQQHDEDIRRLEQRTTKLSQVRRQPPRSNEDYLEEMQQMAMERRAQRQSAPVVAVIAILVGFVMLISMMNSRKASEVYSDPPSSWSSTTPAGDTVNVDSNGKSWVEEKNGTRRPPNDQEQGIVNVLMMERSRNR